MFSEFECIENADLKEFSTIKIGGIARWIVFPKNHIELKKILQICEKNTLKLKILGNGSNILFADAGFDGVLVNLKYFNKITILEKLQDECILQVGAGINLFALNIRLGMLGLSGLEFSYGIPASLGGFIYMNGGCFGHEVCEVISSVLVMDYDGNLKVIEKDECGFDYRASKLEKYIILGAKLRLKREKSELILKNMRFFLEKKRNSQPCDMPSLGSVFKIVKSNPPIYPAKIIDNLGLKGVKIGMAEVSTKHAGFIVNLGGAKASDVIALIEFLEEKLKGVGVVVEREIVLF